MLCKWTPLLSLHTAQPPEKNNQFITSVNSDLEWYRFIKSPAWSVHNDKVIAPELDKIDTIKELLHVKFGHSFLSHFDIADIDIIVEHLCTEECFFFLFITFYLVCTFCTISQ